MSVWSPKKKSQLRFFSLMRGFEGFLENVTNGSSTADKNKRMLKYGPLGVHGLKAVKEKLGQHYVNRRGDSFRSTKASRKSPREEAVALPKSEMWEGTVELNGERQN